MLRSSSSFSKTVPSSVLSSIERKSDSCCIVESSESSVAENSSVGRRSVSLNVSASSVKVVVISLNVSDSSVEVLLRIGK